MFAKLAELGVSKFLIVGLVFVVLIVSGTLLYKGKQARGKIVTTVPPAASPFVGPTTSVSESASPTAKAISSSAKITPSPSPLASATQDSNQPPLLLKGIGINLEYYDGATGKAGDLVFTKDKLQFGVLLTEYGFTIPGSQSSTGQDKRNPQPTWLAPMGTKVHSLVDGIVVDIPKLYSNDYSVMVAPDSNSQWRYETEHVINPVVQVGDRVTAGQVVAEVSPHNKDANSGYGMVEIGILNGGSGGPKHICPFAYLDPSIRDDIQKKLLAFYKSWEEYRGDISLHDEAAQSVPGCLTLEPIDG